MSKPASSDAASQELRDLAKWQTARLCATEKDACGASACYADYISSAMTTSPHFAEAKLARAMSEQKCAPTAAAPVATRSVAIPAPKATTEARIRDGRYLARSQGACGAKPDSVVVDVEQGVISWRHEFGGALYNWSGKIDAEGQLSASIGNSAAFTASGRFTETAREMKMQYPQCKAGVSMSVISKLSN